MRVGEIKKLFEELENKEKKKEKSLNISTIWLATTTTKS